LKQPGIFQQTLDPQPDFDVFEWALADVDGFFIAHNPLSMRSTGAPSDNGEAASTDLIESSIPRFSKH